MTQKIRPRHPEKVKNPVNPIKKKPEWIRSKLSNSKEFFTDSQLGLSKFRMSMPEKGHQNIVVRVHALSKAKYRNIPIGKPNHLRCRRRLPAKTIMTIDITATGLARE